MAAVPTPATILVTGANGFLASWVCLNLLEKGYKVRGAVRDTAKGLYTKQVFEKYGNAFEFVVVRDMSEKGAFDTAVKGVQGVIHLAARSTITAKHPDEIIPPTVSGVINLLESIQTFGTTVERVVYTSTVGVVVEIPGEVLTEETAACNDGPVETIQSQTSDWNGIYLYIASKVIAEKKAWEFAEKIRATRKWDLVSLLPPFVLGPFFNEIKTRSEIPVTQGIMYNAIEHELPADQRYTHVGNWADVRDVALAHVLALEKKDAGGRRFFISAGPFVWQDIYDAVNSLPSPRAPPPDVPKGDPNGPRGPLCVLSGEKSKKILGITYRSLAESATDTIIAVRETLKCLDSANEVGQIRLGTDTDGGGIANRVQFHCNLALMKHHPTQLACYSAANIQLSGYQQATNEVGVVKRL